MFVIICNDVKVKFAAVFSASVLGQETPFCFYIIPASGLFCRFSDDKIKRKMNGFYMGWQNYDRRYREEISEELKNDFTMDKLWAVLCLMQGERFYTARGLEFHYKIRGNEIFVDRKVNSKSITRSSVEMVFRKLQERRQGGEEFPLPVQGPKKLGVFGASYLYPVLKRLELVRPE